MRKLILDIISSHMDYNPLQKFKCQENSKSFPSSSWYSRYVVLHRKGCGAWWCEKQDTISCSVTKLPGCGLEHGSAGGTEYRTIKSFYLQKHQLIYLQSGEKTGSGNPHTNRGERHLQSTHTPKTTLRPRLTLLFILHKKHKSSLQSSHTWSIR